VTLKRVYVLIDARHGIKKNDEEVLDLLDKAAVSYQIVLTKTDKIKEAGLPRLISERLAKISKRPAAFPEVLATSSEKGSGLEELRAAIALAVSEMIAAAQHVLWAHEPIAENAELKYA
jgi:GTP-binding protein